MVKFNTGYIYGLVNPITNKVFYIGKTTTEVKYRVKQHIKGNGFFGTVNKKKMEIINKIISSGYDVQYIIIKEINSPNITLILENEERIAIQKYKNTITNKVRLLPTF